MNDLISVVVPVYNVEKYLQKCIDSIINQTYKKIEIILVNDGSTDNSLSICNEYKKTDSRIQVIDKKNGGLSSARNVGIKFSKGKYICFVDADDYLEHNFVEKLYNKIINNKCDISICNFVYDFENGKSKIRYNNSLENYLMNSSEAILQLNNYKYFDMSACSKMFKKELFSDIRFPEGKFCEDYYVMYLLFDKADKIVYFCDPLYHYFQRVGSITKDKKLKYDFIHAAYEQMTFVEKKYPNLKYVVRSAYSSANMTVYNMAKKNNIKLSKADKRKFQKAVKENYAYVKRNNYIPKIKKIQTYLFTKNLILYNILFTLYRFIYKV